MINKVTNNYVDLQATSVYDFNELTLQELLNKFFNKINECVDVSNKALEFLTWLKEEGLPIEVQKEIEKMYLDGRLTEIINQLANDVKGQVAEIKTDLTNHKTEYEQFKTSTNETLSSHSSQLEQRANKFGFNSPKKNIITKSKNNPIFRSEDSSFGSIYWMWVIKVDGLISNPLGKYYMFYSTDHDGGNGGIGLAYSNAPDSKFTNYGVVYVDTVKGKQTETPSVIYDDNTGYFYMYYHNDGVGTTQSTVLAKSLDCINWERVGLVIDVPIFEFPGNAHTGYFKPFKISNRWVGYHLIGSGDYPHMGISYSYDGINWFTDPRPLVNSLDGSGESNRKVAWNNSNIIQMEGNLYWIGSLTEITTVNTVASHRIGIAPIDLTLRNLSAPVQHILTPTETWENENIRSVFAFVDENKVYIYYQMGAKFGVGVIGGDN